MIKIINMGFGLDRDVTITISKNHSYAYKFYYQYRAINQFNNIEGEAIQYELNEIPK